jgi:lactoylglutathione lyase
MHIEHLAIWVRDLERTRLFYETYFGAAANDKYVNSHKGFSSYFLSFPDGGPRLGMSIGYALEEGYRSNSGLS